MHGGHVLEIVAHAETGLLVPPGDAQALAAATLTLLADPATRQAMGEAGRRRVEERFGLPEHLRRLEAIYADVLCCRYGERTVTKLQGFPDQTTTREPEDALHRAGAPGARKAPKASEEAFQRMVTARVGIVVPCFDEERRIDPARFLAFADEPGIELVLVDDGSRDGTLAVLEGLARQRPKQIEVHSLYKNRGKGEAVRQGMLRALQRGLGIVGYADADLSTPPAEIVRLRDTLEQTGVSVVLGSRVLLAGRRIERRTTRHLIGRVFAGAATHILGMPFYDTQCGAKVFRDTPTLRAALAQPFFSRWAFDVELLGRLLLGVGGQPALPWSEFYEEPLRDWIDAAESKVRFAGMARTLVDLARINAEFKRVRRSSGR
jgi:hypothetical protein